MCSLLGEPGGEKRCIYGVSVMLCSHGGVSSKLGLFPERQSPKAFTEDAGARFKSRLQCFLSEVLVVLSWKGLYQSLVAAVI